MIVLDGTSKQRKRITQYCIQDCSLLNTLMVKLNVLNNYVYFGMANVSCTIIIYFMRGQVLKFSHLVAERCRKRNHLIPYNKKDDIDINFSNIDGMDNSVIVDQIQNYDYKDDDKTVITTSLVDLLRTDKRIEKFIQERKVS